MKERQRWQPEEDALLRAYVKQYGAKEWNMVSQRMGKPLHRDAKSCLERWKNYLKPGIKKGSLTQEEQALVISLQAKYGNKWKKIAAEVPGRTAKRLGKWWEVFKEKQSKEKRRHHHHQPASLEPSSSSSSAGAAAAPPHSQYDHILDTFAEKYVQPKLNHHHHHQPVIMQNIGIVADLSLSGGATPASEIQAPAPLSSTALPPWLSSSPNANNAASSSSSTVSPPSVSLTLSSPSDPGLTETTPDVGLNRLVLPVNQASALVHFCRELEEGRQSWVQHKKEATWRLSRLEKQLESEKARKRREKMEEVDAKIRGLRDEERAFLERIDCECREQLNAIQRDADAKEAKMLEMWASKHLKLSKLLEHVSALHHHHLNASN